MMKNKSPRISRQQVVDPATLARSLVKSVDGAETTVEVELREIREVLALATVHAAGLAALAHLDCGFADGVLDDSHHAIKLLAEGAWRRLRDLSDTLPAQLGTQPSAVERGPGQTPFVMNPAAIHVGIGAKQ